MKYIEFEEIDSTNTYIHDHYQELDDDTIVRAHYQTHGRGRSNHIWEADKNEQLLFSYYMKQNVDSLKVSAIMAYAIVTVLRMKQINAFIKWPNDIYVNNQKIAGILVETIYENTLQGIIIGIGLNISKGSYYSLSDVIDHPIDKEKLMLNIIDTFKNMLHMPFASLLDGMNRHSYLRGKTIPYKEYGLVKFLYLDENCHLVIEDENKKKHTILLNELSLGRI